MLQKVVIIGVGPTGLLLAHYLLRRGKYCVALYEQRPDPRLVDVSQDRTFPISLQERGQKGTPQDCRVRGRDRLQECGSATAQNFTVSKAKTVKFRERFRFL